MLETTLANALCTSCYIWLYAFFVLFHITCDIVASRNYSKIIKKKKVCISNHMLLWVNLETSTGVSFKDIKKIPEPARVVSSTFFKYFGVILSQIQRLKIY